MGPTTTPAPTPTTTPVPSLTTSCTEDENAEFLYKNSRNNGDVIKTCGWLASRGNSAKLCKNKVKATTDYAPPERVCFETCDSCSPGYENPKSKFFWKEQNGKNKYMSCKKLAKRSNNDINGVCAMDNSAGGYGPAYLTCPQTCAETTGCFPL